MSPNNLLEQAFMARIRAEEFQGKLAKLREEFEARPEIMGLKLDIERCEEERRQCIEQAKAAGVTRQGSFILKQRTRTVRTVIPWMFFERFGLERFCKVATIPVGAAEKEVGKDDLDLVVEKQVTVTGVTVEYERPEAAE